MLELFPRGETKADEHPLRAGDVVSRPAGTGIAHALRAGAEGLTYLAYGTRDAQPGAVEERELAVGMEQAGDLKLSVREIRKSFETRNTIEDVKAVKGDDLEIGKEGGETVVSANWSVKIPLVSNISACLDFSVTTAK